MKNRFLRGIPVTLVLLLLLCIPVSAKTKSLVFGIKANEAKGSDDWSYNVSFMFENSLKAGGKVPTLSCKIILPKAFMAKNNTFAIEPNIGVHTAAQQNDSYQGELERKYRIVVSVNKKGKVSLKLNNDRTGQETKPGKLAKIKKSGKNYILTVSGFPFRNRLDMWDEESQKSEFSGFDTKKAYRFQPRINIHSWGPLAKKLSGWIYFDKVKVTAAKSMTVSYKNWNIENIWADFWRRGRNGKVSKTMKTLSY